MVRKSIEIHKNVSYNSSQCSKNVRHTNFYLVLELDNLYNMNKNRRLINMEERDISIKTESGRFNYRVGAIIINAGKVLMVKNNQSPYYYSVGGRVKFGETAHEAIQREVFEETNIHFEIDRLAYIHENFFIWEIENEPFHEISFYYLMKPNNNLDMICSTFAENGGEESLHWLPINELNDFHLYPEFLKTDLNNIPNQTKSCITQDGKTFCF